MSRVGEPNPVLASDAHGITVSLVTLDEWCAQESLTPDWLFLDVEGLEGHVLSGAEQLIQSRGAALGIIVEMQPSLWPASGTNREQISRQIAALGRNLVPLSGQVDPLGEYGHVLLEVSQAAN